MPVTFYFDLRVNASKDIEENLYYLYISLLINANILILIVYYLPEIHR